MQNALVYINDSIIIIIIVCYVFDYFVTFPLTAQVDNMLISNIPRTNDEKVRSFLILFTYKLISDFFAVFHQIHWGEYRIRNIMLSKFYCT